MRDYIWILRTSFTVMATETIFPTIFSGQAASVLTQQPH